MSSMNSEDLVVKSVNCLAAVTLSVNMNEFWFFKIPRLGGGERNVQLTHSKITSFALSSAVSTSNTTI